MKISKKFALLSIFLILSVFSGCDPITPFAGPIVGGALKWFEGEAHKYYSYDMEVMIRASRRALLEMQLPINEVNRKNDVCYMYAGHNDKFSIKIHRVENEITRVDLRVNFMGDKPYAELFYKNVDDCVTAVEFDRNGKPSRSRNPCSN